jgi:hypothetical protein
MGTFGMYKTYFCAITLKCIYRLGDVNIVQKYMNKIWSPLTTYQFLTYTIIRTNVQVQKLYFSYNFEK